MPKLLKDKNCFSDMFPHAPIVPPQAEVRTDMPKTSGSDLPTRLALLGDSDAALLWRSPCGGFVPFVVSLSSVACERVMRLTKTKHPLVHFCAQLSSSSLEGTCENLKLFVSSIVPLTITAPSEGSQTILIDQKVCSHLQDGALLDFTAKLSVEIRNR
eukprot:944410-Amphidinium_carterae.2